MSLKEELEAIEAQSATRISPNYTLRPEPDKLVQAIEALKHG